MTALIIGYGYLGQTLAQILKKNNIEVTGLRRSKQGSTEISMIYTDFTNELVQHESEYDFIYFMASPKNYSEQAYETVFKTGLINSLKAFKAKKKFLFVSSTSVYDYSDGREVTEETEANATDFSGKSMLDAEQRVKAEYNKKAILLRLSGIYGPKRNFFLKSVQNGRPKLPSDAQWYGNRIHVVDAARALYFLSMQESGQSTFIGSDNAPVDRREVIQWMAKRLNVEVEIQFGSSRRKPSNKRCINQRLTKLGFQFKYPSYQVGYQEIIDLL